jgi:hypothetical protein
MKIIVILLAAIALSSCTTTQKGIALEVTGETISTIGAAIRTGK